MNKKTTLAVLSIVLITIITYMPGLSGGFLFDDYINLSNITVFSQFDGIEAYIRYILSYSSGSLKRPISTLSFLLNSTSWPVNPLLFKLTNVFIHLLNSVLLFVVTRQILSFFKFDTKTINAIALFSMAIWTMHPYFVSTTLYVVQRMAMLPVTFMLIGMYFYIKGRITYQANITTARLYIFLGIYVSTFFAVLSKENGIILPIVIILFEYIVVKNGNTSINKVRLIKFDKYFYLFIPAAVVILSFIVSIPQFLENYSIRDFSMSERLLTESRVLLYYLYNFFKPEYLTEGVFADVFETSRSLFNPISTIYSVLFIIILTLMAIIFRKKYPLFSFALLFFFVTNIIESTIVPLELYFEHRGYMSLLFMSLPIAVFLVKFIGQSKIKLYIVISVLTIIPVTTFYRSLLWGDNDKLIMKSADKFPHSVRAIESKANILFQERKYDEALYFLKSATEKMDNLSLDFNYFNFKCGAGKSDVLEINNLLDKIKKGKFIKQDRATLIVTFNLLNANRCFQESKTYTDQIIEIIMNKPAYDNSDIKQAVDYYHILSLLIDRKFPSSFQAASKYLEDYVAFDNVINIIDQFVIQNEYEYAEKLMLLMEIKVKPIWFDRKNYINEISIIRNHISTVKNDRLN